jgi:flagellar basal body-associated protein FliL
MTKNSKSIIYIVVGVIAAIGIAVGIYFAFFSEDKKEEAVVS